MTSGALRRSRRILAVRLPWWPTERLAPYLPEARTHPFVAAGESRNRLIVTAANALAVRAGLTPGMPLADARAIVPGVVVRPADPAADASALERLACWADRFTPRVMPDGADTIFLDIAGCTRLFGGEAALAASLRAALEDFGLTARLALADTPGAAWALARYGADDPAVAPARAGPDGLKDALAELPVAALRLDAELAETLASFGLDRVRSLFAIESVELIRRFGMEPVRRLGQALGRIDEPIVPLHPPRPREARRAFAEPISTAADIFGTVDGLLDELCLTLSRSGEGARRLRLVCHRADGGRQTLSIGTSRPLRRKRPLMGLFAEKLDQVEPGFGIDEIVLAGDVVETIDELQTDWAVEIAAGRCGGGEEELAGLVDRLGNRLGFGRIGRPAPQRSWLPERAVRRERALSPPAADWPGDRRRPLRLLSPPEPVAVVLGNGGGPDAAVAGGEAPERAGCDGAGRDGGSRPGLRAFRRHGRLHRLRAADGPERLECEWWREDAPSRDYYLVEDEDGRRYWLFRENARGEGRASRRSASPRWRLHGVFA